MTNGDELPSVRSNHYPTAHIVALGESWLQPGLEVVPRCGAIAIYLPELAESRKDSLTIYELFHLLGFWNPVFLGVPSEERGVPMSERLSRWWRWPGLESVTWSDIDALRCVFPERGQGPGCAVRETGFLRLSEPLG